VLAAFIFILLDDINSVVYNPVATPVFVLKQGVATFEAGLNPSIVKDDLVWCPTPFSKTKLPRGFVCIHEDDMSISWIIADLGTRSLPRNDNLFRR
jgi:hypothetical protein